MIYFVTCYVAHSKYYLSRKYFNNAVFVEEMLHQVIFHIEADTCTQKSASSLRDLLESTHIIDYIIASSSGSTKGKSRNQRITWSSLFRNVVGYVLKEAESVAKLEEKSSHSSSALQTKKKVST